MSKATKIYIIIICLALIILLGTGRTKSAKNNSSPSQHVKWLAAVGSYLEIKPKESTDSSTIAEESLLENNIPENNFPLSPITEPPQVIKGIYLTSWLAGKPNTLNELIEFINKTEINALVVDVKDERGTISFPSKVQLAQKIGSSLKKYNPERVLKSLRQYNIYPIARIVVFKDPFLATHCPELAVGSSEGGLWRDFKGLYWVDPYNKNVWDYNIAIAKEAAAYGFKEIQFDYIRFTSDGLTKNCRYPKNNGLSKSDVIRDFLKYAYQELKPLGVKVSADVFGLTCSADSDIGIGQVIEKVADGVDIICPMVYPSHYVRGSYKIPDPDAKPYETVYKSLSDAVQKLSKADKKVIIRPWLQDFSLKSHYGREQLLAQIKAVESAGLNEWIFWNPANRYDIRKYRLKSDLLSDIPKPSAEISIPTQGIQFPEDQTIETQSIDD